MAYGTAAGVEALLPAIGKLGTGSTPKLAAVQSWLDQGSAIIDRTLAGAGYTVPVLSTATCYPELTALNELYGAAYAMMARSLDTVQGTDENRSAQWLQMFTDRLAALVLGTLPDVPVAPVTTTTGRRMRFTQLKKVDGYSAPHDDDTEMDS
jgi:hypothetical protein